jgi:hypothetical protein
MKTRNQLLADRDTEVARLIAIRDEAGARYAAAAAIEQFEAAESAALRARIKSLEA